MEGKAIVLTSHLVIWLVFGLETKAVLNARADRFFRIIQFEVAQWTHRRWHWTRPRAQYLDTVRAAIRWFPITIGQNEVLGKKWATWKVNGPFFPVRNRHTLILDRFRLANYNYSVVRVYYRTLSHTFCYIPDSSSGRLQISRLKKKLPET